jgi:hypothetical protein
MTKVKFKKKKKKKMREKVTSEKTESTCDCEYSERSVAGLQLRFNELV